MYMLFHCDIIHNKLQSSVYKPESIVNYHPSIVIYSTD